MQALSIIQPKRPSGKGWQIETRWQPPPQLAALGYPVQAWMHESGLFVLSSVEKVAPEPGEEDVGPEYHISISFKKQRCDRNSAKWVLKQFGLEDSTEDNHVPGGIARHYWRPVADKLSGFQCPCVDSEPKIVEDKGDYIWRGTPK